MSKAKKKTLAVPAAQSREEAELLISRMGVLQRELLRSEADFGDEAAKLKETHERLRAPLVQELEQALTRVQGWCEANRDTLTREGKVKFAALATGRIQWRALPPKVTIRGAETVLETLKRLGLQRFIRTKDEINKEAMLAEPEAAKAVPGVSIGSAGEEFVVEPFQPELTEAA